MHTQEDNWEKEFGQKFWNTCLSDNPVEAEAIKSFIQTLLDRQREDIAREVEGMILKNARCVCKNSPSNMHECEISGNEAVFQVLARLRAQNNTKR